MNLIKQRLSNKKRNVAIIISLTIVVIVGCILGIIGYRVYQNQGSLRLSLFETQKPVQLNQAFELELNQVAVLNNKDEIVKFRFTKLESPQNPDAHCEELCMDWLPTVMSEFEYAGKTFKGTSGSEMSRVDMSYEENGAYVLVPYEIEVVSVDFNKQVGTVKITPKKFTKIEPGKPFTLENDSIGAFVPGKTGIYVSFGTCGFDSPCIKVFDFYVNGEYVETPILWPADPKASPEFQYASKARSTIKHDSLQLRLVESNDKTYATFVLEEL